MGASALLDRRGGRAGIKCLVVCVGLGGVGYDDILLWDGFNDRCIADLVFDGKDRTFHAGVRNSAGFECDGATFSQDERFFVDDSSFRGWVATIESRVDGAVRALGGERDGQRRIVLTCLWCGDDFRRSQKEIRSSRGLARDPKRIDGYGAKRVRPKFREIQG